MKACFRIKPESTDEVLAHFAELGITPERVQAQGDDEVAIDVDITLAQGQVLSSSFKPEWSAIIGIVGGDLFQTRH